MGVVKPLYIYPMNYVFQEIKNVKTKSTYGYEALMRPDNGMNPREYINIRSQMSGTHQIEIDSFFNATKTFADLHIKGYLFIKSFPNECLTGEESLAYIDTFGKEVLSRVVVEIVEYPFVNKQAWFDKQRFMLKHDMMCALDAFGEGLNTDVNSVLFYGPDIVKISRAVIHDFTDDPNRVEFVKALVGMLKDRDVKVLAEGIETIIEFEMLKEFGIDLAQGYYIGMPGMPDPPPFIEDGDTRKYTDY